MFLAVAAERRAPIAAPAPPPQPRPAPRASFPPDGLVPATPAQIRAFFSK